MANGAKADNITYKAYISYSHAVDGLLAPALQAALKKFSKPVYKFRALQVFCDQIDELLDLKTQLPPGAVGQRELKPEEPRAICFPLQTTRGKYFVIVAVK